MAPEIILKENYSKAVDWWSFGVMIYEMLCGLPPFYTTNKDKLFRKIISNLYSLSSCMYIDADLAFPPHLSANSISLLSLLLTKD
jgi:serine/threonine protein kinase